MSKSYYDVKALSNSALKWFEISPLYYITKLNNELDEGTKPWLELGKAIHAAILEPKEYEKLYKHFSYDVPKSDQQKSFCEEYIKQYKATESHKISLAKAFTKNYNIKGKSGDKILAEGEKLHEKLSSYIEFLKSKEDKDKIKITDKNKKIIDNAVKAVRQHKIASKLLFDNPDEVFANVDAHNELEIYFQYPVVLEDVKIDCKSMLDRVIIDHDKKIITIVDLKSTSDISKITDTVRELKYHRQIAFYGIAVADYFKRTYHDKNIAEYNLEAYIVFVQTTELYECRVMKISTNMIYNVIPEITKLVNDIAWHTANNKWDYPKDYYDGDGVINLYDDVDPV